MELLSFRDFSALYEEACECADKKAKEKVRKEEGIDLDDPKNVRSEDKMKVERSRFEVPLKK